MAAPVEQVEKLPEVHSKASALLPPSKLTSRHHIETTDQSQTKETPQGSGTKRKTSIRSKIPRPSKIRLSQQAYIRLGEEEMQEDQARTHIPWKEQHSEAQQVLGSRARKQDGSSKVMATSLISTTTPTSSPERTSSGGNLLSQPQECDQAIVTSDTGLTAHSTPPVQAQATTAPPARSSSTTSPTPVRTSPFIFR